ncbi:MAG: class A beta-lactamase-related serine hydrolase [Patescibacteria group bacterium]|nr:class A beta-lactamase-related serine hydrolase [Patescibacteria group bacterium]
MFTLLYQAKYIKTQSDNIDNNSEIHQSGYKYISPLLECANPSSLNKSKLEEELQDIIHKHREEKNITSASLYLRDLNNGFWLEINEDEQFTPASLLKVPLMIAYLKLAESDPDSLNNKLTAIENNKSTTQNIPPAHKLEIGQEYTVMDVIKAMIIYSDNAASDTLIANINPNDLQNIYLDLNIRAPKGTDTENYMNIQEYSSFFRILYNASYLNKEMSEQALKILSLSQYNHGLRATIPANIVIAHKFGERDFADAKQLHDCGIIYKKDNPYLLCIMTRGFDFNNMSMPIQELSNLIYKNFN